MATIQRMFITPIVKPSTKWTNTHAAKSNIETISKTQSIQFIILPGDAVHRSFLIFDFVTPLLAAQRDNWIDIERSPRSDPACEQ